MTPSSPSETRPGADEWVPERPTLTSIRDALPDCRGCELWQDATQAVMGRGPADADLMLVGEQPGDREDREGEPFVGPAGRVLTEALQAAEIAPERVYVTNAVKHFRFRLQGKRRIHQAPDRGQVTACAPWLAAELEVVRPDGLVLLGGTAGKALYGSEFRVGAVRGTLQEWPPAVPVPVAPHWVLPTVHPAAVLRAQDDRGAAYDGLVADLRTAAAALSGRRG